MSIPDLPIEQAIPQRIDLGRVGVPTTYRGTVFRSRLEAHWAAMFDRMRWPWQYEPLDLSGYVPDFAITFDRGPLLVEVKPALYYRQLAGAARKITLSGWTEDFLIVGTGPFKPTSSRQPSLGLLGLMDRHGPPDDAGWLPSGHAIAVQCRRCDRLSVRHYTDAWFCLSCGTSDANDVDDAGSAEIDALWAESGNLVAWKGPSAL